MSERIAGLREVPYMGVIYVVAEAAKLGYHGEHPDWCNLGQGMPEVGPLPGAPERISALEIRPEDHAYGPVEGIRELREAVAALYNEWFRQGQPSQYTADNVAISAGGRLALTRAFSAVGAVNIGYTTPDYTAYEDLLDGFARFCPVPIPLLEHDLYPDPAHLAAEIERRGLGALVLSNPCNPTGQTLRDAALQSLVDAARARGCLLLLDEYYSHYAWSGTAPVSAAACVRDVDRDPLLLFDGLTKNFRYPGWRLGWTVGPAELIETLTRAGSALDGGAPRPLQRAALELLGPARARAETDAMRAAFAPKRELLLRRLRQMGLVFPREPDGTFYGFASLAGLPGELSDGMTFFRRALEQRVLTVPGEFFDVNPGKRRPGPSAYRQFVRFSYGAPYAVVERGLDRLERMIANA